jgi:hypothetical protein
LCNLLEVLVLPNLPKNATDTWCSLGLGAVKGINYIFASAVKDMAVAKLLRDVCVGQGFSALGIKFLLPPTLSLDLKSIEHGLCKFNKYAGYMAKSEKLGLLFLSSRSCSSLDEEKKCLVCGKSGRSLPPGHFCIFCNRLVHSSCAPPKQMVGRSWICLDCRHIKELPTSQQCI